MEQFKPEEKGNAVESKSLSRELQAQIHESVSRDVPMFFERNSSMLSGLSAELMGHAQQTKGTTGENFDKCTMHTRVNL